MTATGRAFTIMMVDDNPDEIFLTRRLLRGGGIVNHFVSEKNPDDIPASLDRILSSGCDVAHLMVFLDINLNQRSGFDVLQELRCNQKYKDIKIIMLSGSNDIDDMMEAFDLGANGYMVKPFSSEELFATLNNIKDVRYQLVQ